MAAARHWIVQRASSFVEARKLNARRMKHYYKRIMLYVRIDLKEIAFPSPMPNPPGYKPKYRPRLKDINWKIVKKAWVLYKQTWTGEYFEPGYNDDKQDAKGKAGKSKAKQSDEPSVLEELAVAAQLGGEHLKPTLQRIYMTKLSVYRDALRHFVEGCKQGLTESIQHTKSAMKDSAKEEAEREGKETTREQASSSSAAAPGK